MLNIFSSTSGCRKFMALTAPFIQTAKETSAFMFVYSVMDRSCFEFVYRSHWALIKRIKNGQPFSAVLVGNKSDVDKHVHKARKRQVSSREGAALARQMSAELGREVLFLETSAKLNDNVTTAFAGLAYAEMQRRGIFDPEPPPKPRSFYDYCVLS